LQNKLDTHIMDLQTAVESQLTWKCIAVFSIHSSNQCKKQWIANGLH
jgi:hypothetical protein